MPSALLLFPSKSLHWFERAFDISIDCVQFWLTYFSFGIPDQLRTQLWSTSLAPSTSCYYGQIRCTGVLFSTIRSKSMHKRASSEKQSELTCISTFGYTDTRKETLCATTHVAVGGICVSSVYIYIYINSPCLSNHFPIISHDYPIIS